MTVLNATMLLLAAGSFRTLALKQYFVYDKPMAPALPLSHPTGLVAKPIHFASGAAGSLTNRIVVGVDDGRVLLTLRQMTGYIADEPLAFHAHTSTALFRTPELAVAAANALLEVQGIRYAHPDFKLPLEARTGLPPEAEPLFGRQWHLHNTGQTGGLPGADIGALAAWEKTRGDRRTLVAMIDLGFEQDHPDLVQA